MNSKRITKSNAIVNASYRLSVNEQRIVLFGLSQIDPRSDEFPLFYEINIREFAEFWGIDLKDRGSFHKDIQKALITRFWEREFSYFDADLKRVVKRRWLSEVQYGGKDGMLAYEYNPKLKKELQKLARRFTSYFLSNVADMKSAYAMRIYEIAIMYLNASKKNKTAFSLGIKTLKERMSIEDKYKRFCDFKPHVLEIAKRDINKHSDIKLSYKVIKRGRSPHEIEFTVSRKPKLNQAPLTLPEAPAAEQEEGLKRPLLSTTDIEDGKQIALEAGTGWDIYAVLDQFYAWVEKKGRPRNPRAAWLAFVRKKVALPP